MAPVWIREWARGEGSRAGSGAGETVGRRWEGLWELSGCGNDSALSSCFGEMGGGVEDLTSLRISVGDHGTMHWIGMLAELTA